MASSPQAPPQGPLGDAPLADVLIWAYESRATGCVTLRTEGGVNRLYLSEGRPAVAVLAAGYRPLPQLLLELGWLDELALDRALEEVYGGVPLEQALVKTGAIQESRLEQALALQEGRNLEALGALPPGQVTFAAEPLPASAKVRVSPERALLDVLALPSGRARASAQLHQLGGLAARLNSGFDAALPALALREPERRAVGLLRAGVSVDDFLRESELPPEQAQALLAVLTYLGLVEPVDLVAEAEIARQRAEAERRHAEVVLAQREAELLDDERGRQAAWSRRPLSPFERAQRDHEERFVERRAAQAAWRANAAKVQQPPAPHASIWLAAHDTQVEALERASADEASRVSEVEARAVALEHARLARARWLRAVATSADEARQAVDQIAAARAILAAGDADRCAWIARAEAEAHRVTEAEQRARRAHLERLRAETERLEAERAEAERLEAERAEAERLEAERVETERLEAERAEAERVEAERAEAERVEAERLEAERAEAERVEAERVEAERVETERLEAERVETERLEAERVEAERTEAERLAAERAEADRLAAERAEADRLAAERAEAERAEAERAEAERAGAERAEAERLIQQHAEAQRQSEIADLEAHARRIRAARKTAPLSEFETDRRAMLAARASAEANRNRDRLEALHRARRERERAGPGARPTTLSAEDAQREIQRRFDEQARLWLDEEDGEGPDDPGDDVPRSLEESLQRQLRGALTTDLESLLSNSLNPWVRPISNPASPLARPPSAGARPPSKGTAPRPPSVGPASALRPPSPGARPVSAGARPASPGPSGTAPALKRGDTFEFTFDSFSSAGSIGDLADVESIWDDGPGGDMGNDDEARARRARLRRLGMQNTGLIPGPPRSTEPAAAEPSASGEPGAARAAREETPPSSDPVRVPTASPGAGVRPPTVEPATGSRSLAEEIEARYARIKTEDHFARLGVSRSATPQQVKQAFVALAKRFHPDKLPPDLSAMADKAREVFSSIRESHDLLQNDKSRADYLANAARPPTPVVGHAKRQVSGEAQLEARKLRTLADIALKKKAFAEAEQLFAKAHDIEQNPNDLAAQAWCIYLDPTRNKDTGPIELRLRRAFASDPRCERAHYVSGVIARAAGDTDKAEMHFRAAIETNPNHADAALELRVIERRRSKTGENSSAKKKGFFGR